MASKGMKILYWFLGILAVIIIVLVIVLSTLGVFTKPELALKEAGPYHFIFSEHKGPFTEISAVFTEMDLYATEANLVYLHRAGMYLSDPERVPQEQLEWRVGFIVQDSVAVPENLKFETLPKASYIIATIEAHAMIAAFKNYPALEKWVRDNNYQITGPALEIYTDNGMVKSMFPVTPK